MALTPPAGLEPAIFGLEVRRLVHSATGACVAMFEFAFSLSLYPRGVLFMRVIGRLLAHLPAASLLSLVGKACAP